jgi:hypothetical protein
VPSRRTRPSVPAVTSRPTDGWTPPSRASKRAAGAVHRRRARDAAIDGLLDRARRRPDSRECGDQLRRRPEGVVEVGCHRVAVRHGSRPRRRASAKAVTRFLAASARADARLACGTTGTPGGPGDPSIRSSPRRRPG